MTPTPGGGLNGNVTALKVINGSLYATGYFTAADGVPAYRIARWDGTSWSVVAGGYSGVTHLWRRNNVALFDGPTSQGSTIAGASTPNLSITRVAAADSGEYTCVVAGPCGSTSSAAAQLTVTMVTELKTLARDPA